MATGRGQGGVSPASRICGVLGLWATVGGRFGTLFLLIAPDLSVCPPDIP